MDSIDNFFFIVHTDLDQNQNSFLLGVKVTLLHLSRRVNNDFQKVKIYIFSTEFTRK